MLTIHHITTASEYYSFVENLLESAFPKEECRDKKLQRECTDNNPKFKCNLIQTTYGQPIGVITRWDFGDFIYIEHFAIDPTLRSQGYGSEALKAFIHEHGKPLVLEAEPPTDALSIRRIKFYERIGLTLYDFPYMQPAYTEDSHPVELRLMGTLDTNATPLPLVSQILHREVYGWTAND